MISFKTTVFEMNNEKYQFNPLAFNQCINQHSKKNGIKKGKIEDLLAEKLFVSSSAIHNWRFGSNGPASIELVKNIAKHLKIDYMTLLKRYKEIEKMGKFSTLQIESLKRVYDAIIDFLDDFDKTDGFTGTLWYEFQRKGSNNPEDDIYDYAQNKIEKVQKVLLKEYFYLHDTEVYEELSEYIENDLYDTFDGKLGYAYRFEAIPDGNPTTFDDYSKALQRINEIIEKYTK